VGVPNVFIKQQLERKYNQLIADTLAKNGMTPSAIEYKIHSLSAPKKHDEPVILTPQAETGSTVNKGPASSGLSHTYRQGLNERYTFDNFIVGSGNELAYAACQAVAQAAGTKYMAASVSVRLTSSRLLATLSWPRIPAAAWCMCRPSSSYRSF
jgi:chromosomal replication initiator protein